MTYEAPKLEKYCQDSFRSLEEDSILFQNKEQMKSVTTVDFKSVKVKGIMGKGAFAIVKAATVDRLPGRRNSSFSKRMFTNRRGSLNNSGIKFAIKSLRGSLHDSLVIDGAKDLAKEAMFLGTIRHPNIIYLHGAAENPGRDYFLVLEPLSRTLTDQMITWSDEVNAIHKRFGKKEIKVSLMHTRLAAILGLVSALSYLHRRNICYRDLKTGNIGFDKCDKIKLFDFGLATELKEVNRVGVDQYHATACTGTPRYMAREVYYGEPYGLPCDVFSFSLILYEVVVLHKATAYDSFDEHAEKVYEKNRRPKIDRIVPKEVRTWIMTGWSNDPTVRPKMARIWSEMTEYLSTNGYSDAF